MRHLAAQSPAFARPFCTAVCVAVAALALLSGCGSSGASKTAAAKPPHGQPVAGLTGGAVVAGLSSWPGAQHDTAHSGTATVTGPQHGTIKWARALEGKISPGPGVGADGTIYATSNAGVLHALDPATGKDRWTLHPAGAFKSADLSTTVAILKDGSLLWTGPGPALYRVSSAGKQLGRFALGATGLSPAVSGSTAYVAEMGGVLHKLDVSRDTPREVWSFTFGRGTSYGSPALSADHKTIYTTIAKELVAVRDEGGTATQSWRFAAQGGVEISPAVAPDGTIVISTNDKNAYGVSPAGKQRWAAPVMNLSFSSPAVTPSGLAVFGDNSGLVYVVNAKDGKVLARQPVTGQVWTAPAIDAKGDIYVGTHSGHVIGYVPDGRRLFDVVTKGSVESYPALDHKGTLYIGSEDGKLYAIGG